MLAYVTNSTASFNLGADEIIYLNDVGVPSSVVAAMIQRDQALKELSASAVPAPAEPAPEEPGLYAPQPAAVPAVAETMPEEVSLPAETVSYPVFYDSLAPYGTWVDVAGWGPCWRPTVVVVNPGWRPYCDGGQWIYSDCGWYWLSSYTWGWAPFHYGRWFRHHRMGWCWTPDTVWGPSWVCWRNTATHCGWAPLPPRASFTHRHGLAYRGRPVGSAFGFGLGAGSFTFVETSRFCDRHLNRHALAPEHATRIFEQAPPSTSIVGNHGRVINHGVPPSRIAEATRTAVHKVTIRPINHAPERSARGERFEGNSRTLSVFRPEFPAPMGTGRESGSPSLRSNTGEGGPLRTELRGGDRAPVAASHTPPGMPDRRPQAGGSTVPAEPGVSAPSTAMSPRPSAPSPLPAGTRSVSVPSVSMPSRDMAPKPAQPLILHEADRSRRGATASSIGTANRDVPRPTTTFLGKKETSPQPGASQPSASVNQAARSQAASSVRDALQRPAASPQQTPLAAPARSTPTRSAPPQSALRAKESRVRSAPQRSLTAPSSPSPAQVRPSAPAPTPARSMPTPSAAPVRSTPAPSFTPAPARTISRPPVSSVARTPAMESRPSRSDPTPSFTPAPTRSFSQPAPSSGLRTPAMQSQPPRPAPSAPTSSAPARQDRSSSDRRGR